MGLFSRRDTTLDVLEYLETELEQPETRNQLASFVLFMAAILGLRLLSYSRLQALTGEHRLDLSALNDASLHKEVFLAYLNAALLEPVLNLAGLQEITGQVLIINIFTLGSICWWIWMVSDAFDATDVMQHYKYHVQLREETKTSSKPVVSWLCLKTFKEDAMVERQSLVGTLKKDVALWFMIACIGSAWLSGPISHRDVIHAYAVVFLWGVLHRSCRCATTWTSRYVEIPLLENCFV